MRALGWAVAVALAAWSDADGAPISLGYVEDPGALCAALRDFDLDGGAWVESAAVTGGWHCARIAPTVAIGRPGSDGRPTTLTYSARGGPDSIDRLMLQLDLNNPATADEGRAVLLRAAAAVAGQLQVRLPPRISTLIVSHPLAPRPDWRPTTDDPGRRTLHEERQGWVRVRLQAEETRLAALVLTFANPEPSGAWE